MSRLANTRRRPCRRGEYIVIAPEGNTVVVQEARSASDALEYRLTRLQVDPRGDWLVSTGKATHTFRVNADLSIRRLTPDWWEEADDFV